MEHRQPQPVSKTGNQVPAFVRKNKTLKGRIRLINDVVMLISFLVVALTGIIKMPVLYFPLSRFFEIVPFSITSLVHDYVGVLLVGCVFIHLILTRRTFFSLLGIGVRKGPII